MTDPAFRENPSPPDVDPVVAVPASDRESGVDEKPTAAASVPSAPPARKRPGALEAGARFGRYEIVRILGTGGMGAVYEAMHLDLKKRVALKTLHQSFAENEDVQARFMREGEAASRIRHPHVVDVTDFGIWEGVPFMVMEFLEGESLAQRIKRGPQLGVAEVVDIILPVCAAVGAAHEASVIHRDLKPENIFLAKVGRNDVFAKVVDFGVSKVVDPGAVRDLTTTNAMVGSPAYMPPEQIMSSKSVEARSDEYAIGVTIYEAVTGRKPFIAETLFELMAKIVGNEYDPPRVHRPELPPSFQDVIRKAMKSSIDERYPSVEALGKALLPFASQRARSVWAPQFGADPLAVEADAVRLSMEPATPEPPPKPANAGETAKYGAVRSKPAAAVVDEPVAAPIAKPAASRGPLWIGVVLVTVVAAVGATFAARGGHSTHAPLPPLSPPAPAAAPAPAPPTTFHAQIQATPSTATFELDGQPAGVGSLDRTFSHDGTEHSLRVSAPGYEAQSIRFEDTPPPASIALVAAPLPVAPPPTPVAAPVAHAVRPTAHAPRPASAPTSAPEAPHPAVGGNGALIIP